jgi:hypothetical protein
LNSRLFLLLSFTFFETGRTCKSVRISVHIYANNSVEAIEEAFNTYLKAKITAIDNKIPLAPVEIKQ